MNGTPLFARFRKQADERSESGGHRGRHVCGRFCWPIVTVDRKVRAVEESSGRAVFGRHLLVLRFLSLVMLPVACSGSNAQHLSDVADGFVVDVPRTETKTVDELAWREDDGKEVSAEVSGDTDNTQDVPDRTAEADVCTPDCNTDPCAADDGCGSSCKVCSAGYYCAEENGTAVCVADCNELCLDKECGFEGEGECQCGECDDGNQCTDDMCDAGHKCVGLQHDCDDGLACTDDDCEPETGCVYEVNCGAGGLCDDNGSCCLPVDCATPGFECGNVEEACDGPLDCGDCAQGDICVDGICSDGSCGIEMLGLAGGFATDVVVQGSNAYVAMGHAGLYVFDVVGDSPVFLSKVASPGITERISISSGYAFVSCFGCLPGGKSGLQVVDIGDPAEPAVVGAYDAHRIYSSFATNGLVFAAAGEEGLVVVDVSNAGQPVTLGVCDTPGFAKSVWVSAGYAFVADDTGGMQVVDVTEPGTPTLVANLDWGSSVVDVAFSGSSVFVAMRHSSSEGHLAVVDVVDPTSPQEIAMLSLGGECSYKMSIAVAEGLAYISNADSDIVVVDVSEPVAPEQVNAFDAVGDSAIRVAPVGDRLYIAGRSDGLVVLTMNGAFIEGESGKYNVLGATSGIAVAWPYAYLAESNAFEVVDVSDPADPILVSATSCPVPHHGLQVAVSGTTACVLSAYSDTGNVTVVDVSNPSSPIVASELFLSEPMYMSVAGDFAYVAGHGSLFGSDYLSVVDISNPYSAAVVGTMDFLHYPSDLEVQDNYAFVPCPFGGGLIVVDVGDPYSPVQVAQVDSPYLMGAIEVAGDYAYATFGNAYGIGLAVLDISDPTQPEAVAELPLSEEFFDNYYTEIQLGSSGSRAFISGKGSGCLGPGLEVCALALVVADLSNPLQPFILAEFETPLPTNPAIYKGAFQVVGGKMYFAMYSPGIGVFDLSGCW